MSPAARVGAVVAANRDLLAILDRLMVLPSEACACGSAIDHMRCRSCGACDVGSSCPCEGNTYLWIARQPFAARFAGELGEKIRMRGWAPSAKQIALVHKLAAESTRSTTSRTTADKPAIMWMTPRSRSWKKLVKLVEREFNCSLIAAHYGEETKDDVAFVRAEVSRMIADATGYDVLATVAEYSDAMQVTAPSGRGKNKRGDRTMHAVLEALLDLHSWIVREKKASEPRLQVAA